MMPTDSKQPRPVAGRGDDPGRNTPRPTFWQRALQVSLQGQLLLSFLLLLTLALVVSYWLFLSQIRQHGARLATEQAQQISYSLSLMGRDGLQRHDAVALDQIARDLLKSPDLAFVGFMDAEGVLVAVAGRDPDLIQIDRPDLSQRVLTGTTLRWRSSAVLGDYVEAVSPVRTVPSPGAMFSGLAGLTPSGGLVLDRVGPSVEGPRRGLLGYSVVGIAQGSLQRQAAILRWVVLAVGAMLVLLCIPLAWLAVRRITSPLRQLAAATHQIRLGRYETVNIQRNDAVGDLANAFNEMACTVIAQSDDLRRANRDLEHKVQQRTGELEQSNRRLSAEIAEKEQFVRAISHDLNAPLRNIRGMAAMLLNKSHDPEQMRQRLQRICGNADALGEMVSQLLELSRLRTQSQKLQAVDVTREAREIGQLLESELQARGIELTVQESMPRLRADRMRIRQMLQNLVDNAVKYMGEGSPPCEGGAAVRRIVVSGGVEAGQAVYEVSDTGIGIEDDDLPKLFQVFRRGRHTAESNIPGKGVGLAGVQTIAQSYGGEVTVQSRKGRGSTFRIALDGRYLLADGADAAGTLSDAAA